MKKKEIIDFKDIKSGMIGFEYFGVPVIIKHKGTLKQMKKYMTGSQAGYEEYLHDYDKDDDYYVACADLIDRESFDHPLGSTVVYRYGFDGVKVPKHLHLDQTKL